jgi:hypothetical protein
VSTCRSLLLALCILLEHVGTHSISSARLHVLFKPTPSRLLDNSKAGGRGPPTKCKADIRHPKAEEPKEDACGPKMCSQRIVSESGIVSKQGSCIVVAGSERRAFRSLDPDGLIRGAPIDLYPNFKSEGRAFCECAKGYHGVDCESSEGCTRARDTVTWNWLPIPSHCAGPIPSQTCRDPDCYMGRVRPLVRGKLTTDEHMADDPSFGCCCCNCWCHKMGDLCEIPNGNKAGSGNTPNLDSAASFGSECPLGSVLSSAKWDPSCKSPEYGKCSISSVRSFMCTECKKGTYKNVTGRYDSLIVCPPGSPPASLDTFGMGLRYVHYAFDYVHVHQ